MLRAVEWNRLFWIALFLALVVRLVLAFGVQQIVAKTPGRLCLISGDAEGYWELAGKIVAHEDYCLYSPPRYVLRMPGFPALLAIPRFLAGPNPFVARIVLALVGTLACWLSYWLGRELVDQRVGVLALFYTALSPTMCLFSVLFLSETAFAAGMVASLIAIAQLVRRIESSRGQPSTLLCGQAVLAGFLVALATMMRPTWLLVGPGIAVLICLLGGRLLAADKVVHEPVSSIWKHRSFVAISVCLGMGILVLPWSIRNRIVTGHLIPTTLWVGPSLYDGLNPHATGDSEMTFFETDQLMLQMSEYEMDQEYRRRAWAYLRANPGRSAELAVIKQTRYWSPAPNSEQFAQPLIRLIAWIAYLPLIGLALLGFWVCR